MVTQTMPGTPLSTAKVLSIAGAVTAILSLAMGVLILYVLPAGCSFVGIIELSILVILFFAGLIALFVGKVLLPRFGRA